jgi:hypothetical protein
MIRSQLPMPVTKLTSKDRGKLAALLADDFPFDQPIDIALGRAAYLNICWPNNASLDTFGWIIMRLTASGSSLSTWRAPKPANASATAKRMVRPARSLGWNLPHDVAKGQHK